MATFLAGTGGGPRIDPAEVATTQTAALESPLRAPQGRGDGGGGCESSPSRAETAAAMRPLRFSEPVGELFAELPLLSLVFSDLPSPARPRPLAAMGSGARSSPASARRQSLTAAGSLMANTSGSPALTDEGFNSPSSTPVSPLLDVKLQMRGSNLLTKCALQATLRGGAAPETIDPMEGCECTICQAPVDASKDAHFTLKTLPCGHAFHVACWDKWEASRRATFPRVPVACPVCRRPASEAAPRRAQPKRGASSAAVSGGGGSAASSPAHRRRPASTGRLPPSPAAGASGAARRRSGSPAAAAAGAGAVAAAAVSASEMAASGSASATATAVGSARRSRS